MNKIAIKDVFYNYYTNGCGLHPNAPNNTKRRGMMKRRGAQSAYSWKRPEMIMVGRNAILL